MEPAAAVNDLMSVGEKMGAFTDAVRTKAEIA